MSLYNSARWQRLRKATLKRDNHTCQICAAMLTGGKSNNTRSIMRPAVVDHIVPHKDDTALFHDPSNLWAVCCDCHDQICQSIEARHKGNAKAIIAAKIRHRVIGLDGYPKAPPNRWVDRHHGKQEKVMW